MTANTKCKITPAPLWTRKACRWIRGANRDPLIATVSILVASALMAIGCVATDRPRRTEPTTDREPEARILRVLDEMYKEEFGMWNVPPEDGSLLRILAETTGARKVVEIGTSNGCSALWFCLALRTSGGRLITHEIDDYRASLARDNFKRAGVEDIVTIVEGDAHKTVADITGPIDILFLDGDKTGNLDYLEKLLPLVRPGGLILAHNTTDRADEMKDYIKRITTDPNLETIFLHKDDQGLALTLKKRKPN